MVKKKILGAALGNCVHVAGIINFLNLAEGEGYQTVFLGPAVPVARLVQSVKEEQPDIVAVSYRLTAESAKYLFMELKEALGRENLAPKLILGSTPPVAEAGKETGIFEAVFSGIESREDIINYLGQMTGTPPDPLNQYPQTLPERIAKMYPIPLIRHHFGLPSLAETIEGAREIASAKVLDILSIGPDQNAQEHFFHPENMNPKLDGTGGVPLRKPADLEAIYAATRCGNYPLVRCYAGTQYLIPWAEMLKDTINIAWGAVPLCWYGELDGRSERPLLETIQENQQAIRWYASNDIPVEVNESHQWALRNTTDVIEVVTAYLASLNAKRLGVKYYVMQYMLNTPADISHTMDLAKMLAKIELIEALEDDNFQTCRMVRTGLASLSPHPDIAKGQLASSMTVASALRPHIIHVVGYSEGDHAANAREIIESCNIIKGVAQNCAKGMPDMLSDPSVTERKKGLLKDAAILLDAVKSIADENTADAYTDAATISRAVNIGLLDAPHLKGNKCASGKIVTRIINGACQAVDHDTKDTLPESERVMRILREQGLKKR